MGRGTRRAMVTEAEVQDNPSENKIALRNLVPENHKLYHLFNFIGLNYGDSLADIIKVISAILDFDKSLKFINKIRKSPVKSMFNLFRYSLPAGLYGIELVIKIKRYINQINKEHLSEYEKSLQRIKDFLELEPKDGIIESATEYLNEEIIQWLLTSPKTEGYKISGFYNKSFEILQNISIESEETIINILVEYKEQKIILNTRIRKIMETKYYDLQYTSKSTSSSFKVIAELESLIINDYIRTFNIKRNILEYRDKITLKKRSSVEENINQFNVEPFIKEIKKVLVHDRKRGYGFIGFHGTGKSIILKKIEEILTDVLIIKFGPEKFSDTYHIKKCFKLIRMIQPAIVFIEDMDALGFKEKNERVSTFINEIDDINNDLNIVLIVTINDTKQVHRTIIDRPGRFDEIIEIKAPQSGKEAYEVMASKFNRLKQYYTEFKNIDFPSQNDLKEILEKCIKNKFTQAELTCGIIEKVFITLNNPENSSIISGIENAVTFFEASKKNLQTYSFSEKIEFKENVPPPIRNDQSRVTRAE